MLLLNEAYAAIQKVASWHGSNTHWTVECIAEFWRLEDGEHAVLFESALKNGIKQDVLDSIWLGR